MYENITTNAAKIIERPKPFKTIPTNKDMKAVTGTKNITSSLLKFIFAPRRDKARRYFLEW